MSGVAGSCRKHGEYVDWCRSCGIESGVADSATWRAALAAERQKREQAEAKIEARFQISEALAKASEALWESRDNVAGPLPWPGARAEWRAAWLAKIEAALVAICAVSGAPPPDEHRTEEAPKP